MLFINRFERVDLDTSCLIGAVQTDMRDRTTIIVQESAHAATYFHQHHVPMHRVKPHAANAFHGLTSTNNDNDTPCGGEVLHVMC